MPDKPSNEQDRIDGRRRDELRERVKGMLDRGMSQAAIARQLHKSVSTIAFHVRNLGVEAKEYLSPEPVKDGKRRCPTCGKRKTLGAFKNERQAECTMCVREKSKMGE
jgi:IS30 family transposase